MNILLIYTGGTIGMVQNAETGALESFDFQQLQQHVPELYTLGHHIDVHTFQPPHRLVGHDARPLATVARHHP